MSTTGTAIHNSLPMSNTTSALTLLAIKSAVVNSWPSIKLSEYAATAGTITAGTFTYSLSSLTLLEPELGIADLFVAESTTEPEVRHNQWRQRYDQSAGNWTVIMAPELVSKWAGKAFNVAYQYRHPAVTALSDTLYLPSEYLDAYVMYWYAQYRLSDENASPGRWGDLLVLNRDAWQKALRINQSPLMPGYNRASRGTDRMRV